jgi:hypothetical protein
VLADAASPHHDIGANDQQETKDEVDACNSHLMTAKKVLSIVQLFCFCVTVRQRPAHAMYLCCSRAAEGKTLAIRQGYDCEAVHQQ